MVEALLRVMHELLLFKAKDGDLNMDLQTPTDKPSVSMFYLNNNTTTSVNESSLRKQLDTQQSDSPQRRIKDVTHLSGADANEGTAFVQRTSNPDVNEIIVKIEMKKFQNLIENRIKHKNNLLQADMKRVYPLTKKNANGGMTLYDQHAF